MIRLRERWPGLAVRLGALPGAIGMTAAQIAQGATIGQIAVTAVCASLFLATMWLIARGAPIPAGSAGTPCREPLKMVPIGLSIVAVVMGFTAAWGIWVAAESGLPADAWHALAYSGVLICTVGAMALVRRARIAYLIRYVWPCQIDSERRLSGR